MLCNIYIYIYTDLIKVIVEFGTWRQFCGSFGPEPNAKASCWVQSRGAPLQHMAWDVSDGGFAPKASITYKYHADLF